MNRIIFACLIGFVLIASSVTFSAYATQNSFDSDNILQPTPTPTPKQISKIKLNKNQLRTPCSPANPLIDKESCDENMTIDVSAFVDNANNSLSYEYEVTGGQIVGQGKYVFWNLANVNLGTYTIFARLEDSQNRMIDISETKTITVEECNCGGNCICPVFYIDSLDISTSNKTVKRGDEITFSINFSEMGSGDGDGNNIPEWTVSGGKIIYENEYKSIIKVKVSSDKNEKELKIVYKMSSSDCDGACIDETISTFKIIDNIKKRSNSYKTLFK